MESGGSFLHKGFTPGEKYLHRRIFANANYVELLDIMTIPRGN